MSQAYASVTGVAARLRTHVARLTGDGRTTPKRWRGGGGLSSLTRLRQQRGLTQQALADAAGIHVTQLRRYEAGTSQPTLDALRRIANNLATSID